MRKAFVNGAWRKIEGFGTDKHVTIAGNKKRINGYYATGTQGNVTFFVPRKKKYYLSIRHGLGEIRISHRRSK